MNWSAIGPYVFPYVALLMTVVFTGGMLSELSLQHEVCPRRSGPVRNDGQIMLWGIGGVLCSAYAVPRICGHVLALYHFVQHLIW